MSENTPKAWVALYSNLGELAKSWKLSNKSVLGFHWKKIPPFSLIWPQVDFPRIQRLMGTSAEQATTQANVARRLATGAQTIADGADLRLYYQAMTEYAQALATATGLLAKIAGQKQDQAAKRKVPIKAVYELMKEYETQVNQMLSKGQLARVAWQNLDPKRMTTHPG